MAEAPEDRHLRSQLLRVYQADIKTVDAFCTALLRENTHLLAPEGERYTLTPDFRVLDEQEAELLRQRVLSRVLERFYDGTGRGRAPLLADTLGAGRDDSALEDLVLETYEKLQSHADPLNTGSRKIGRSGTNRSGDFDETPYGRRAAGGRPVERRFLTTWRRCGRRDSPPWAGISYKGYGEKFLRASRSFAHLGGSTELGSRPRFLWTDWNSSGCTTSEGNDGRSGGRETEGGCGRTLKGCRQRSWLPCWRSAIRRLLEDLADHGPSHDWPF